MERKGELMGIYEKLRGWHCQREHRIQVIKLTHLSYRRVIHQDPNILKPSLRNGDSPIRTPDCPTNMRSLIYILSVPKIESPSKCHIEVVNAKKLTLCSHETMFLPAV